MPTRMCMRSPVSSILHKKSIKEGRKRKSKDKKPKMYSDGPLFSPMRSLSLLSVDFHKAFIILLIPDAKLFLVNSPVSLGDPVVVSFSKVLPNPHMFAAVRFLRVSQCHLSFHVVDLTQRSPLAQFRVSR